MHRDSAVPAIAAVTQDGSQEVPAQDHSTSLAVGVPAELHRGSAQHHTLVGSPGPSLQALHEQDKLSCIINCSEHLKPCQNHYLLPLKWDIWAIRSYGAFMLVVLDSPGCFSKT